MAISAGRPEFRDAESPMKKQKAAKSVRKRQMADRVLRRRLLRFSLFHGHLCRSGSVDVPQNPASSTVRFCGIRVESSDSVADSGQGLPPEQPTGIQPRGAVEVRIWRWLTVGIPAPSRLPWRGGRSRTIGSPLPSCHRMLPEIVGEIVETLIAAFRQDDLPCCLPRRPVDPLQF